MLYRFRTLLPAVLALALAAVPLAPAAETLPSVPLRTGETTVISTPHLTRVAIGDGKVAGVLPVGNSEIVVSGRAPGRTTLVVWNEGGRHMYDVVVTEQTLVELRRLIARAINNPNVSVDAVDRSIVVSGTVPDSEALATIADVVLKFEPVVAAAKWSLVNAVAVNRPLGQLQDDLRGTPATANVHVERDGKGNLVVSGAVLDRSTAEHVLRRVRALAGPYLAIDGKVIDRIETSTVSQVSVKIYVMEVDETALHDLGVNLQSATFHTDGTYTLGGPNFPVVESPTTGNKGSAGPGFPGRALTIGAFFRAVTLAPTVNLVLQSGHGRLLSSPDLVTLPGKQAEFLVGGQIPIPVSTGPQQLAIQYKDYGVKLQVTPTILGDGNVETVIAPEVSDLDFQDGVTLNGFVVPALKTSKLSTDVITRGGESIVMGGLLRHQEQRTLNKIPGLADLPILGQLFRSTHYLSSKTDVVFVMTPEILTR